MSRGRAVLLVANTADPYSRGLRVARSLAAAGWEVEIAAVSGPDVPDEERDGEIVTRRYHASGIFKRWSGLPPTPKPPTRVLKDLVRRGDRALKACCGHSTCAAGGGRCGVSCRPPTYTTRSGS